MTRQSTLQRVVILDGRDKWLAEKPTGVDRLEPTAASWPTAANHSCNAWRLAPSLSDGYPLRPFENTLKAVPCRRERFFSHRAPALATVTLIHPLRWLDGGQQEVGACSTHAFAHGSSAARRAMTIDPGTTGRASP